MILPVVVLLGVMLQSGAARAFDTGEFWLSAAGGWSRLTPLRGADRPSVDGVGGSARVLFALSDAFGLALEGSASRYRGFSPAAPAAPAAPGADDEENGDEEGMPSTEPGPAIAGIAGCDLGLTLVYAIDVFALVPQIALGAAAARLVETRGAATTIAWDIVWRIDAGLDYRLARRFAIGLWATFDAVLFGASPWSGRTNVALRLTVPLGGG